MGIDFHTDGYEGKTAHWSYSGFSEFRLRLANEANIHLKSMQGFGGSMEWSNDDIVPLLHHSDCDGDLSPEDCAKVAPRLLELISEWNSMQERFTGPEMPEDFIFRYDKQQATLLAQQMKYCAENKVKLQFC